MEPSFTQRRPIAYARRYTGSFDTHALINDVLELPEFRVRLEQVGESAAEDRRKGLAWREYPIGQIEGDQAAVERWRGEQRCLARYLPPAARGLISVLSRDLRAPIHFESSGTLAPASADRLRRIIKQSLRHDGDAIVRADRTFMHRQLRILDPAQALILLDYSSAALPGGLAVVSATSAAVGSWMIVEPKRGYPIIGSIETQLGSAAGVRPF